jgi:hypothetical protein
MIRVKICIFACDIVSLLTLSMPDLLWRAGGGGLDGEEPFGDVEFQALVEVGGVEAGADFLGEAGETLGPALDRWDLQNNPVLPRLEDLHPIELDPDRAALDEQFHIGLDAAALPA